MIKASALAFICTFFISALALLFAQGRIFPFLSGPWATPLANGCLYWSIPGLTVEFAARGFYASRTVFSDLLIVFVNAALYAIPLILLLRWSGKRRA